MPYFLVFVETKRGAEQLAQNPGTNSNSKHIDARHHILRELVRQGAGAAYPRRTFTPSVNTRGYFSEGSRVRRVRDPPKNPGEL